LKAYQYLTEISKFVQSRNETGGKFFYAEKHAQIITDLNSESATAKKFSTSPIQPPSITKLAHKLTAKLDIKKTSHFSEVKEIIKPFEEDVLAFCETVSTLENLLYKRNNLTEFEQSHVMYDTPSNLLLGLMGLVSVLVDFLTKFEVGSDLEGNIGGDKCKLPSAYDSEVVEHIINNCLMNSVNLVEKYPGRVS